MNKLDLQFQIDQLRKDKIIYALEATATSATALVVSLLGSMLGELSYIVNYIMLAFAVIFWSYAMIGNYFRLQKIRKLESLL
jgi:hypothetical protein